MVYNYFLYGDSLIFLQISYVKSAVKAMFRAEYFATD